MKKLVAVLMLVIVGYLVATWFVGTKMESQWIQQSATFEEIEGLNVKVVGRDFRRGFFSSSDETKLELGTDLSRILNLLRRGLDTAAPAGADSDSGDSGPLRFTIKSTIAHGPLVGFSSLAAARVDSELIFDGPWQATSKRLFGDKPPLQVSAVSELSGATSLSLSSPGFDTKYVDPTVGSSQLKWGGMEFAGSTDGGGAMPDKQGARMSLRWNAPQMQASNQESGEINIKGVSGVADVTLGSSHHPFPWLGSVAITIDDFGLQAGSTATPTGGYRVQGLSYSLNVPAQGEFVDIEAKAGAKLFELANHNYGPAHFEMTLKHLHALAASQWSQAMTELQASQPTTPPAMLAAQMIGPTLELLKYGPEFLLQRVSFISPQGEASLRASLKLVDAQPTDMNDLSRLLQKLDSSADLALPDTFLALPGGSAGDAGTARQREMLLMALVAQGYLTRDGGLIKTKIVVRDGEMTLNGKPFNPMALLPKP